MIRIDSVKSSMVKILSTLGFKSIDDRTTIIPSNAFEMIDSELVMAAVREYRISFWNTDIIPNSEVNTDNSPRSQMSAETKFETINRILELKHEVIIDQVKDFDELEDNRKSHGYRLEAMPAGF